MNISKKIAAGLAGAIALISLLTSVVFATANEQHLIKLDPPQAVNPVGTDHTVTARVFHLNGNPMPGVPVSFKVVLGPNTGEVSDPGECSVDPNCITDPNGQTSWRYTGTNGVGIDVIEACILVGNFGPVCTRAEKEWIEPVRVACIETVNPHGKTVPPAGSTTLPGPKGGQNEDGFYELGIEEKFPVGSTLWVTDAFGSGPFGPFAPGDKVKITEAPGAVPSSKKIGSSTGKAGAVLVHITLKGDALVFAIDPAGVKHGPVSCLVPPPPK